MRNIYKRKEIKGQITAFFKVFRLKSVNSVNKSYFLVFRVILRVTVKFNSQPF